MERAMMEESSYAGSRGHAALPARARLARTLPPVLFTLLYLTVAGLFSVLRVWEEGLFQIGPSYVLYNALRVLLLGYLFLICFTLGKAVLHFLEFEGDAAPAPFDYFLIASYAGVSV